MRKGHKELTNLEREDALVRSIYGDDLDDYVESYINGDYTSNYLNTINIRIDKYLSLLGVRRDHKDELKTKSYIDRHRNSCMDSMGVDNPSKCGDVKRLKQSTFESNFGVKHAFEIPRTLEATKIGYSEYISDENIVAARGESLRLTCGHLQPGTTNPSQFNYVRKGNIEKHKARWSVISYDERLALTEKARAAIKYDSALEVRVRDSLDRIGVNYTKHIFLYGYNFDIKISGHRILIEVQGDYWHANPKIYKSNDIMFGGKLASQLWDKDKRKYEIVSKQGWILLYLWENDLDIMNDVDIDNLLMGLLNEQGYSKNENKENYPSEIIGT